MPLDNATMISEAIVSLNDQREREARTKINNCIQSIVARQKRIKELEAAIADVRESITEDRETMTSITIEVATAADILGT